MQVFSHATQHVSGTMLHHRERSSERREDCTCDANKCCLYNIIATSVCLGRYVHTHQAATSEQGELEGVKWGVEAVQAWYA